MHLGCCSTFGKPKPKVSRDPLMKFIRSRKPGLTSDMFLAKTYMCCNFISQSRYTVHNPISTIPKSLLSYYYLLLATVFCKVFLIVLRTHLRWKCSQFVGRLQGRHRLEFCKLAWSKNSGNVPSHFSLVLFLLSISR